MADGAPKVSKPVIVIAGIALLAIVALLGMKVLGGGGGGSGDGASDSTAATAAAGAPAASTTTTTAPAEPSTPNQSFDVFTTKNPFQPLVTDSTATSGSTTDTTSPPVDTSDGAVPPPIIPQEQAPAAGTPVSVLEVSDATGATVARVQVGSTVYTVAAGETFATSYRVVSLDAGTGCGQFQYGDTPFELCTGQQTLK
jgi:hypothetical protein